VVRGIFALRLLSRSLVKEVIEGVFPGPFLGVVEDGKEGVVGEDVFSEDEVSHRYGLAALKTFAIFLVLILILFPCELGDVVVHNLHLVFGVHEAFEAHNVVNLGHGNAFQQNTCWRVARRKIQVNEVLETEEVDNFVWTEVVLGRQGLGLPLLSGALWPP